MWHQRRRAHHAGRPDRQRAADDRRADRDDRAEHHRAGRRGPDTTGPDATDSGQSSLDWGTCNDPSASDPRLQCATLDGAARLRQPDRRHHRPGPRPRPATGDRHGAVLFNPGGPGASGFDPIAVQRHSTSPRALGHRLASISSASIRVASIDPAASAVSPTQFVDQHLYIDDTPDTPEEQALKDEADTRFIDGCKQKYGDTLRFFSTANTARDMDAIRAALGDDQISFLGLSYGTYLGATYATMFPDHVRAMVLDSAFEPIGDTVRAGVRDAIGRVRGAFNNWVSVVQERPDVRVHGRRRRRALGRV